MCGTSQSSDTFDKSLWAPNEEKIGNLLLRLVVDYRVVEKDGLGLRVAGVGGIEKG